MGNTPNKIRPLALVLVENRGKILAKKDFDSHKQEDFYRIPGGGIELGETSEQALRREIREEFNAELEQVELLEVLENIFTYEGKPGHEIVFLYRADFVDKGMYEKEELVVLDEPEEQTLHWFDKEVLLSSNFYPEGVEKFVKV